MEFIKIGIPYELELIPEEDSTFEDAPAAVLFNAQSRTYYDAYITESEVEGNYIATWTADMTSNMPTGTYSLELYTDSSKQVMFKNYPWKNYATAITVSKSPNQNPGYVEEESESESSSES